MEKWSGRMEDPLGPLIARVMKTPLQVSPSLFVFPVLIFGVPPVRPFPCQCFFDGEFHLTTVASHPVMTSTSRLPSLIPFLSSSLDSTTLFFFGGSFGLFRRLRKFLLENLLCRPPLSLVNCSPGRCSVFSRRTLVGPNRFFLSR